MRFGAPAGDRLGPGAPLSGRQLLVRVDARSEQTKVVQATSATGIDVPACGAERVWQTLVAAGVPEDAALELRYAFARKPGRAVWTATVEGHPEHGRSLDGSSCAIIVRR